MLAHCSDRSYYPYLEAAPVAMCFSLSVDNNFCENGCVCVSIQSMQTTGIVSFLLLQHSFTFCRVSSGGQIEVEELEKELVF